MPWKYNLVTNRREAYAKVQNPGFFSKFGTRTSDIIVPSFARVEVGLWDSIRIMTVRIIIR
jgi:hypothetical protein